MNLIHFFTFGVLYGIFLAGGIIVVMRNNPEYLFHIVIVGVIVFIILDLWYMSLFRRLKNDLRQV